MYPSYEWAVRLQSDLEERQRARERDVTYFFYFWNRKASSQQIHKAYGVPFPWILEVTESHVGGVASRKGEETINFRNSTSISEVHGYRDCISLSRWRVVSGGLYQIASQPVYGRKFDWTYGKMCIDSKMSSHRRLCIVLCCILCLTCWLIRCKYTRTSVPKEMVLSTEGFRV